jgi:hypothetical protein
MDDKFYLKHDQLKQKVQIYNKGYIKHIKEGSALFQYNF